MMGVAQGVLDLPERAIGHEAVMHDDAALQIQGDRAALFLGAVEGERLAGGRVQPVELARDPEAGFVEMADLRLGQTRADPRIHPLQVQRASAHPGRQTRRAQTRRAEQVAQRLRRAILGKELVDVEIDRRRLDPPAILRRPDHAVGEPRPGHAPAARATVNQGSMFSDDERALDEVEHLPRLEAPRIPGAKSARQCRQWDASCRTTWSGSATRLSVSPLWPFCPPLGLPDASRRLPAMRGFFVKPSLEGGFELVELSWPRRRLSSATSARNAAISARNAAISSSASAARIIDTLTPSNPPCLPKSATQIRI